MQCCVPHRREAYVLLRGSPAMSPYLAQPEMLGVGAGL